MGTCEMLFKANEYAKFWATLAPYDTLVSFLNPSLTVYFKT